MATGKSGMADEERGHRVYRETYGRGGGETFEDQDYPHSYAAVGPGEWRTALRAYVNGHDRGWETERKESEAEEATAREDARRADGGPGPDPSDEEVVEAGGGGGEATARTGEGTRFGVSVPDRHELRFHRSASVWRDRLPDAARLPRHTDRRLDTARGRGGQA